MQEPPVQPPMLEGWLGHQRSLGPSPSKLFRPSLNPRVVGSPRRKTPACAKSRWSFRTANNWFVKRNQWMPSIIPRDPLQLIEPSEYRRFFRALCTSYHNSRASANAVQTRANQSQALKGPRKQEVWSWQSRFHARQELITLHFHSTPRWIAHRKSETHQTVPGTHYTYPTLWALAQDSRPSSPPLSSLDQRLVRLRGAIPTGWDPSYVQVLSHCCPATHRSFQTRHAQL